MNLIVSGLASRIYYEVKTTVFINTTGILTSVKMGVDSHSLKEIEDALKVIKEKVAETEAAAQLILDKEK